MNQDVSRFDSVHAWRQSRLDDLAAASAALESYARGADPETRERLLRVASELRERRYELRDRKLRLPPVGAGEYALEERARDRRAFFEIRARLDLAPPAL